MQNARRIYVSGELRRGAGAARFARGERLAKRVLYLRGGDLSTASGGAGGTADGPTPQQRQYDYTSYGT